MNFNPCICKNIHILNGLSKTPKSYFGNYYLDVTRNGELKRKGIFKYVINFVFDFFRNREYKVACAVSETLNKVDAHLISIGKKLEQNMQMKPLCQGYFEEYVSSCCKNDLAISYMAPFKKEPERRESLAALAISDLAGFNRYAFVFKKSAQLTKKVEIGREIRATTEAIENHIVMIFSQLQNLSGMDRQKLWAIQNFSNHKQVLEMNDRLDKNSSNYRKVFAAYHQSGECRIDNRYINDFDSTDFQI